MQAQPQYPQPPPYGAQQPYGGQQPYQPQPYMSGQQQQQTNVVVVSQPGVRGGGCGYCGKCPKVPFRVTPVIYHLIIPGVVLGLAMVNFFLGVMKEEFTICGWLMCLCFFPWGIICCLMMTEKRCQNCGR